MRLECGERCRPAPIGACGQRCDRRRRDRRLPAERRCRLRGDQDGSGRADHADGALYRLRQTCAHPEGKRDPAGQPTGTLKLQADGTSGALAPLCEIVVARNRITTVTVSVLETSAALPMPQQRHRRGPRLRELNVIPDCRVAASPESITTGPAEFAPSMICTNRGYGFRARGLRPRPGMT
jgi:hypothetical protein